MLSDLELVDCGSLDVLLYCADDLTETGQGDFEIDESRLEHDRSASLIAEGLGDRGGAVT